MDQLCKDFLKKHGLSSNINIEQEEIAIYWLEKSNLLIAQSTTNNDKLLKESSWGFIQFMLDRAYQHMTGSLVLYLVGMKSSCEALSRVAFESSVNVLYILNNPNRMERIFQYFSTYASEERKQNQKWEKSIANLDPQDQIPQRRGLAQKTEFLILAENFLGEIASHGNASYPPQKTSINTFDKFQDLSRENAYRTLYAAMSSQIHNDAEDLLNNFLLSSVDYQNEEQKAEFRKKLVVETENFSRLMVYSSLQYFLEACLRYCENFELDDILHDISQGYNKILNFTARMAVYNSPHLFK